jgi:spore germination protein KC
MGIREHFDFLVRHPQPRESALVFVSKGKAAALLELYPPIELTSAEALRELVNLKIGARVTVEQFRRMLVGDSQSAVLPLVHILPESKSSEPFQTIPYIYGAAVFKKDKMVGESSEKVMQGVIWIRNKIKTYTATIKIDGTDKQVSLNPVNARINLIPKIQGEKWSMTIKVKTEGVIVENGTTLDPMDAGFLNVLEKSFEQDVKERIQLAVDVVQHQLKADIFEFATEFHRKYPKRWKQEKEHWDEGFPKVQVNIEVHAHILRPGLINRPGGMPKEEVKKK